MEPNTSGYSSPKNSNNVLPKSFNKLSSLHIFNTDAIRDTKSAACCLTRAVLLFKRKFIIPHICGKYGLVRIPY